MKLPKTRALVWKRNKLLLLDQRVLPHKTVWLTCRTWREAATAIRQMVVRGAPAIGITASHAVVLAARARKFRSVDEARRALTAASSGLLAARPTALNLRWALERMERVWKAPFASVKQLVNDLAREAQTIEEEDRAANQAMGRLGAALLPRGSTLVTLCNTGSLATGGPGQAVGVIWRARQAGTVSNEL